jgi:TP901 family phage tail tape measure protein
MAKGTLTDDKLTLTLSVNASEAQKAIHGLEQENRKLEQSNRNIRKGMTDLIAAGKKESDEFRNLEKELKNNNTTLQKNREEISRHEKTLGLQNMTMKQLQKRAQDLQKQLNNTVKSLQPEAWNKLQKELEDTKKQMGELAGKTKTVDSVLSNLIKKGAGATALGNLFTQAINGLGRFLGSAFNTIKEFEQANADLASVLGTTRSQITGLTEDAKRLGATTSFTASQVTLLQTELAKLGFGETQIKDMTADILDFASATGADLPSAAALAGSALRAFGLESSEMNRVVSTLAVATTKSALNFGYLQASLSTIAPVAKTFGFTIEDTTALLGTLANSGFDASSAATATRNILLNLADSGGRLAVALGRPVKSLDDLIPAFAELKARGVDLNETLELTDKRSVAAFNTFLDNAKSIGQLRDSITGAGDALKKMVDERMNTVHGSILILQSAWEGLMLTLSSSSGIIKKVIDALASLLGGITKLVTGQSKYQKEVEFTVKALLYAGTVIVAYIATVKLQVLWNTRLATALSLTNIQLKAKTAWLAASRVATLAAAAAQALFTGNLVRARAAMHLFNPYEHQNQKTGDRRDIRPPAGFRHRRRKKQPGFFGKGQPDRFDFLPEHRAQPPASGRPLPARPLRKAPAGPAGSRRSRRGAAVRPDGRQQRLAPRHCRKHRLRRSRNVQPHVHRPAAGFGNTEGGK